MNKLAKRHEKFAKEYVRDLNATRAAKAAGYSQSTAASQGSRLLTKSKIQRLVDRETSKWASKCDISIEMVAEGLRKQGFYDPRAFYHEDGSLKSVPELDEETAFALAGFETEKLYQHYAKGAAQEIGTISKVKMADRTRALELLGRHLKMFTDKVEHTGLESIAEAISKGRKALENGDAGS
ncbi:MAG: terminase small subunit [Acidobacteriota bacterium]|nr:terminase small subunit [Acidobacteriota bacterium]